MGLQLLARSYVEHGIALGNPCPLPPCIFSLSPQKRVASGIMDVSQRTSTGQPKDVLVDIVGTTDAGFDLAMGSLPARGNRHARFVGSSR